ncbi:MAG: hypothetical protein H7842_14825, partial [Gammaproteobacteria bacterium SHHR-1]
PPLAAYRAARGRRAAYHSGWSAGTARPMQKDAEGAKKRGERGVVKVFVQEKFNPLRPEIFDMLFCISLAAYRAARGRRAAYHSGWPAGAARPPVIPSIAPFSYLGVLCDPVC